MRPKLSVSLECAAVERRSEETGEILECVTALEGEKQEEPEAQSSSMTVRVGSALALCAFLSALGCGGKIDLDPDGIPAALSGAIRLSASPVSGNEVDLSWTSSLSNIRSVAVRRGLSSTSFSTLATLSSGSAYTDKAVTANMAYYYRVIATSNSGVLYGSPIVPVLVSPGATCGDGVCDAPETCTTCPEDCGACSLGLSFPAPAGTISAPFYVSNGSVQQDVTTSAIDGTNGSATYTFTVPVSGQYSLNAVVNAPNTESDSFFLNVDSPPRTPANLWDITPTQGFETHPVSFRGSSPLTDVDHTPQVFTLSAGVHQLFLLGREDETQVQTFTFVAESAPPDLSPSDMAMSGTPDMACIPSCSGSACGSDGCGGSCGSCTNGQTCANGSCITSCVPAATCSGHCGMIANDGCGNVLSCGGCASGQTCTSNVCVGTSGGGSAGGTLWAGIIDPARAIDWSKAGVQGGIPNRTSVCATLNPGATGAQINSAINACPGGQVVMLNAGTYNIGDAGIVMKSDVTLRGAGADQTQLIFTTTTSCGGWWGSVCMMGTHDMWDSSQCLPGGTNSANWTGGYTQGSTQITLTNVGSSGIRVGQYIYLDQADDTTLGSNFFICESNTAGCAGEGGTMGRNINGVYRAQIQMVQVTAINGNTYTISPGLYSPNWRPSQSPGAWWPSTMIQNAGIENLTIDSTNAGGSTNLGMMNAANCWVRGTRFIRQGTTRNMIWMAPAVHTTVENSYFYGGSGGSQHYGVESFMSSDNLVQNNIFEQTISPLLINANLGSVYAYNYAINDVYSNPSSWFIAGSQAHTGGVEYVLLEGNILPGFNADDIHGNGGFGTLFRNYLLGSDTGKTDATVALALYSYQRYYNLVGNVLGTPGYSTTFQGLDWPSAAIYDLGWGDAIADDPLVATTLLRWGNYDTVNGAARFLASEVPSAVSPYGNALPSSQSLPPSFYLTAKPSWWPSATPWPPVGPDVTSGNISGLSGHAHTIPAEDCFRNVMHAPADGSGGVLSFNASNCY